MLFGFVARHSIKPDEFHGWWCSSDAASEFAKTFAQKNPNHFVAIVAGIQVVQNIDCLDNEQKTFLASHKND